MESTVHCFDANGGCINQKKQKFYLRQISKSVLVINDN